MSDKTSDALLPCPFCGGEAEFYRTPVKTNGGWCDGVAVRCKNCEARTNRVLYDAKKHPNDEEYDEAAAAWNQRKPMERILERLENNSFWTESTYDIDGYCNDDSQEVIDLDKAIEIVKEEGGFIE